MNEFERVKRPFDGVLELGQMLLQFVSVIKCAPLDLSTDVLSGLSWPCVQTHIRKTISNNLY